MTAEPVILDNICVDLAPTLCDLIVTAAAERRTPSAGSSNIGGWKSSVNFLTWPGEPIRALARALHRIAMDHAGAPILRSWAMINRAGSQHAWHRHGMALSGVYYVACGNPAIATRFRVSNDHAGEIVCEPKVGRLVLFGDLLHSVPVYDGAEPRITIAFDVAKVA